MKTVIIRFDAFNPRKNLPPNLSRKRSESHFLAAFERNFVAQSNRLGIGGRYFPLSGYGIADFVWAEPEKLIRDNCESQFLSLTAFELKLRDWKRALSQAYRYSYFADRAVVVLPPDMMNIAITHIELFKKMRIGLWVFDSKSLETKIIHQPLQSGARNPVAKKKALARLNRHVKFRSLFK